MRSAYQNLDNYNISKKKSQLQNYPQYVNYPTKGNLLILKYKAYGVKKHTNIKLYELY